MYVVTDSYGRKYVVSYTYNKHIEYQYIRNITESTDQKNVI